MRIADLTKPSKLVEAGGTTIYFVAADHGQDLSTAEDISDVLGTHLTPIGAINDLIFAFGSFCQESSIQLNDEYELLVKVATSRPDEAKFLELYEELMELVPAAKKVFSCWTKRVHS